VTPEQVTAAGDSLYLAEQSRQQRGLLSAEHPTATMDDAYAVQRAFVDRKLTEGRKIIGWKIGLTSRAMQQQLNITTPDSGVLFDDMAFATGCAIPANRFIAPRIEAEIAFVMKAPLNGDVTRDQVLDATDYVTPALEILDTRIVRAEGGKTRTIIDTISDNAANAGIVMGDHRHDPNGNLRWVGAIVKRDGVVEETGLGAGVLDDPVMGIIWLARRMGQYGMRIEPGQVILSGSFIRAMECPSGCHIDADFGPFGHLSCSFA
jgi:2-oxo-hept-3-ene-1,7-dioate hydratase